MALDVAADNTTESSDKVVDLARRSAADCVSDTNTVNTLLVNSLVKAEKVDKVTLLFALATNFPQLGVQGTYSERVLRRESDLLALAKRTVSTVVFQDFCSKTTNLLMYRMTSMADSLIN
ncbi:hypothetical protein QX201_006780 [Fusarium graminearum]